ncbi:histidinol dehydrogenase [Metarhizobium album]|uniref:Histidinol dehydrogenase n=1 Tax=Metarhizobium album TaxID=2182425 RepID=A0A2U2DWP3_9HYPH|nr:histidinol dehydrogenase [Rhizobium album]PWE57730.1 histidinol dehydrogenase [Rhizobium album]
MALWLEQASKDFEAQFAAFLTTKREVSEDVNVVVRAIIDDVRARGDAALADYSARFDGLDFAVTPMRVGKAEIDAAFGAVDPEVIAALELAAIRIEKHHSRQLPKDDIYEDDIGVGLGSRWTAIEAVGLYVPGGTASYPSSVLMNALPAKVAGVPRIVMVVPALKGEINPTVLAAARIAGVEEIYRIGGAQAVAALAYGTETIAPVAKIVGPGNAYVAAAKRHVFGTVGIDMIAGPSEVLVIADKDNDPEWLAADLLAQAEHDRGAQSILITDDAALGHAVEAAVERQIRRLGRSETAAASWRDFGAVILVPDLASAVPLADRIAAEHLELAVDDPEPLLAAIRNAGAIFVGRHTPEVIGDYVGGSNHVLPTARSARFSSGLSVLDYVKRTSILRLGAEQLRALGPAAITLANSEGLDAHARSVAIRLNLGD